MELSRVPPGQLTPLSIQSKNLLSGFGCTYNRGAFNQKTMSPHFNRKLHQTKNSNVITLHNYYSNNASRSINVRKIMHLHVSLVDECDKNIKQGSNEDSKKTTQVGNLLTNLRDLRRWGREKNQEKIKSLFHYLNDKPRDRIPDL